MKTNRVLVLLSIGLGLLLTAAVTLAVAITPASALAHTSPSGAPQAAVTRVTDMRVTDYRPVMTVAYHITDTLAGSLPNPFNWYLDNFDPNRFSNLTVSWAGGGNCVTQSNHNINCTGTLTQFEVAYRFYYTPTLYGSNLYLGWSGGTSFSTNYTLTLTYPDPLVYVSSPVSPPTQNGHLLTWHQANTQSLEGYGFFHDPRVQVLSLPLIIK